MKKSILFVALLALIAGCSGNLYGELADKDADTALIFDAKTALNNQNYDDAISLINNQVSASGQLRTEAREVLAGAYAGKCGLNFIDYIDRLVNATTGTAFELAAAPFIGLTVDPSYCLLSLNTLELIGPTATRTTDQNIFASIVGMVLMGTATRVATDTTPANGDGVPDSPNISCALTNSQVDQIVLGYGHMSKNFGALTSAQLGSSSGAAFSDSIAACTAVAGSSCEITDPAQITPLIRNTIRDLMNTAEYGIGLANGSNPLLIPAACP